jgi:hypothetical protein
VYDFHSDPRIGNNPNDVLRREGLKGRNRQIQFKRLRVLSSGKNYVLVVIAVTGTGVVLASKFE